MTNNRRRRIYSRHRSHEKVEYSRITPHIYIGTNLCCYDHAGFLRKLGVSVDIDLEYTHAAAEKPRMDITLYLPTRDHHAPALDKLIVGTALIDASVKSKKKVYVHCKNGHGRAPTLAAAHFIAQGMTPEQAVSFLKKKRPVVHLNREQMSALRNFKARVDHERSYW